MNLFLAIAWGIIVIGSIHNKNIGMTPDWIMVILPSVCLTLDNLFDWLEKKLDEYIDD